MKIKRAGVFWTGITILVILIIIYFIKFQSDYGSNYTIQDSLLGIIIFHNPFILALYLLIAVVLIVKGLKNKIHKN